MPSVCRTLAGCPLMPRTVKARNCRESCGGMRSPVSRGDWSCVAADAELAPHPHLVIDLPRLGHPALSDAEDHHLVDPGELASRGNALEGVSKRPGVRQVRRHPVA